jgi:hypothetical protein
MGRHRAGEPDEVGALPTIDGLIEAVRAERDNAQWRGVLPGTVDRYDTALTLLGGARATIVEARKTRDEYLRAKGA